jgi:hypothetical protein
MNFSTSESLQIDAKFGVGAEAANVIRVTVQLVDRHNGNLLTAPAACNWYLSAVATGLGVTTATTGGIAIGTIGTLLEWTNNVSGLVITNAAGVFNVDIEDTGAKTIYLVLVMPDGKLQVSPAITFTT